MNVYDVARALLDPALWLCAGLAIGVPVCISQAVRLVIARWEHNRSMAEIACHQRELDIAFLGAPLPQESEFISAKDPMTDVLRTQRAIDPRIDRKTGVVKYKMPTR